MSDFSMKGLGGAFVWIALLQWGGSGLALAQAAIECDTGVAASDMLLFDAHNHLDTSTLAEGYDDVATLVSGGVEAGVLVLGPPDSDSFDFALDLQAESPVAVRLFSMPATATVGGGVKTYTQDSVDAVEAELEAGARGVGEMKLRHSGPPVLAAEIAANQVFAMEIYALAETRGVPVTIHFETREKSAPMVDVPSRIAELTDALATYSTVTFIWAHAGDTGPLTVRSLIEAHDNLYVDLSTRNPYFIRGWPASLQSLSAGPTGTGLLKADWQDLFSDYPNRFLFGLDLSNSTRWSQLDDVVGYYRGVLEQLDPDVAEKMACKNAQMLFSATDSEVPALGPLGGLLLILLAGASALVVLRSRT
ncbi:MAG: amidohydrolase family protein [Myxococcota bacterium]|nr:amidohydrolase family protein [Myxococcota bacterium]